MYHIPGEVAAQLGSCTTFQSGIVAHIGSCCTTPSKLKNMLHGLCNITYKALILGVKLLRMMINNAWILIFLRRVSKSRL